MLVLTRGVAQQTTVELSEEEKEAEAQRKKEKKAKKEAELANMTKA
jgi:hypothetical protein